MRATAVPDRLREFDALVLTSLLWFLAKFLRYAFPPLFDPLRATYGVSDAELGTAFTGFMLVYAAMQFPSGLLADRFGSARMIVAGALVSAAAALSMVVPTPFPALVGAMLIVGAGTGVHKTVAVRLLSRAYPARTGRALGVFDTFGAFGGVAAPVAVVFFASTSGLFGAGWRTLFLAGSVLGVSLAGLFALRAPRRTPDEPDGEPDAGRNGAGLGQYVALFRERQFSVFVAQTLLFSFAYNGLVAFLPRYLASEAGLSDAVASLLFSALFAVSLVQLVTGETSDRIGALPVIGATLGLAAAALAALVALTPTGNPALLGAAVVCIGLGAHGFRPVRGAYLMSVVPESVAGGSLGVVRTLLMGAGAIAPAVVGVLSETVGFRPAFALLAASLVGAAALVGVLWLGERRR